MQIEKKAGDNQENRRWYGRWRDALWLAAFVLLAVVIIERHSFAAPAEVDVASLYLQQLDGTPLAADTLKGKPVVLNFWAPWCPPCRLELPWLERLHKENPNLLVLGVEDDTDEYANAIDLARRVGLSYSLVRSSESLHRRVGQVHSLPTTLFISRSGHVVHAVSGMVPEPLMRHFAADAEKAP